jgi:hypothetical protein
MENMENKLAMKKLCEQLSVVRNEIQWALQYMAASLLVWQKERLTPIIPKLNGNLLSRIVIPNTKGGNDSKLKKNLQLMGIQG